VFKEQVAPELERPDLNRPELKQEGRRSPMNPATDSWWRRLRAAMTSFRPKSPGLVFGPALAILLFAVGWVGWQALRGMKSKQPEVAETMPAPNVSPS